MKNNLNKLDKLLIKEIGKEKPNEEKIREMVKQGANVNAVDELEESLLMQAIQMSDYYSNNNVVKLLIKLGADINYDNEGWSALGDACMEKNVEIVELLLKMGTEVNLIHESPHESLLNWAVFEEFHCRTESKGKSWLPYKLPKEQLEYFKISAVKMKIIVRLLKKYGAKYTRELQAEKPEKFITINKYWKTGLFTKTGNLKVELIPGVTEEFCSKFKKWIKKYPSQWTVPDKNFIYPKPEHLKECNKEGMKLAKQIKKLVGEEIKVELDYIDPKSAANKICNINTKKIK